MIHDEICTYEVCKLAKEKGFPQRGIDSNKYWFENFKGIVEEVKDNVFLYEIYPESRLARQTTQSLLQRWLREEKGYYTYPFFDNEELKWTYVVRERTGDMWIPLIGETPYYDKYEEAMEGALKFVLENLV